MISENTTLTIGLVVTLLSAAFSFGIMWTKIQVLGKQINTLQTKVDHVMELLLNWNK